MDLYLKNASATEEERVAVDALLGPPATRWEGGDRKRAEDGHISYGGRDARSQRHLLLPVLHAVQKQLGWISDGALNYVAQRLTVPPAEVYGVATFYAMLSTQPRPKRVAHVCDDIACRIGGANSLIEQLTAEFGPAGTPSGDAPDATWIRSPCLGLCERAPAVMFQLAGDEPDETHAPAAANQVSAALTGGTPAVFVPGSTPQTVHPRDPSLRLLRRIGVADPDSLDDYRKHGGYQALRRALGNSDPPKSSGSCSPNFPWS